MPEFRGSKALQYAVAMGAEVLEFHFTDQREGKVFRDHKVSLMPAEVKALIEEIQLIKAYQGDPVKKPTQIELENGHELSFRRAVYPLRDLLMCSMEKARFPISSVLFISILLS